MSIRIDVPREELALFCQRNRIRRLAFFGSVLRDDFGPDSDVDVLVQFEEGETPSLFAIVPLEDELTEMLGRKADLRTPEDLGRYFRDKVVSSAQVVYAA